MGYESKLIVVRPYSCKEAGLFGEVVAEINLSVMPNAFFEEPLFTQEIKSPIYLDGKEVTEDCYGKPLCFASVPDVLKVLYKCESEVHYRRTAAAIGLLTPFTSPDWEDVKVIHYGY